MGSDGSAVREFSIDLRVKYVLGFPWPNCQAKQMQGQQSTFADLAKTPLAVRRLGGCLESRQDGSTGTTQLLMSSEGELIMPPPRNGLLPRRSGLDGLVVEPGHEPLLERDPAMDRVIFQASAEAAIQRVWEAHGGPYSSLGLPLTGAVTATASGDGWRGDFRSGTITVQGGEARSSLRPSLSCGSWAWNATSARKARTRCTALSAWSDRPITR